MTTRKSASLKVTSALFLDYLDRWYSDLPVVSLKSLLKDHAADRTAIVIVDVVNGFCKEGKLASPRVGRIIQPIVELVRNAESQGINYFLLPQDQHPQDSREFEVYPEHCVEGTIEGKTVDELQELPNAYKFVVFPKVTINPGLQPDFQQWLQSHEEVTQLIVVGDCTDLCVHQLAMYLKLQSIQKGQNAIIIVPADCVDTFDIETQTSERNGILPHPADLMHRLFLYHMRLNGVRIVAGIQ